MPPASNTYKVTASIAQTRATIPPAAHSIASTACHEVVVSGGTFNTPQILKLSGIGSAEELNTHGIPVVVDLPGVGTNMQDNYEIGVIARASQNFSADSGPVYTVGHGLDPCLDLWRNGTGPYTATSLDSLMYQTKDAVYGERDLFMWGLAPGFRGFWPVDTVNVATAEPADAFDFSMIKMHPQSRKGTVTLRSADPRDTPEIGTLLRAGMLMLVLWRRASRLLGGYTTRYRHRWVHLRRCFLVRRLGVRLRVVLRRRRGRIMRRVRALLGRRMIRRRCWIQGLGFAV